MPKPLGLQLYTLRDEVKKQGLPAILKLAAEIGYRGVEFAGLQGLPATEVKSLLTEYGLESIGAHVDIFDPKLTDQNAADARTLGYRFVIKSLPREAFASEEGVRKIAEQVNGAIARYEAHGLTVALHNHYWEFVDLKKSDLLNALSPKAQWQLDIYWVQVSGQDPAKLISQLASRVPLLHVKDGPCDKPESGMTAVGAGKVDVKACLAAAEKANTVWYAVELDRCDTDMIQAVKDSYTYLTGNKLAAGRK